ncbi:unnamed protein product [Lactuca virosa]|uniref:NB-ARC domain-containing protein n=1 Tax=Lactuca virosa TaxID=75947 RepID=A0AAU9NCM9_9ASTR|nr:unnamed protein product [Lactuca virosa]
MLFNLGAIAPVSGQHHVHVAANSLNLHPSLTSLATINTLLNLAGLFLTHHTRIRLLIPKYCFANCCTIASRKLLSFFLGSVTESVALQLAHYLLKNNRYFHKEEFPAMDVVSAILKPVAETLMEPVKKHLGYLISSTQHVRDMRRKMGELDSLRHAEEDHLDRNIRTRLEISFQVRSWLEEVEKIDAKVKTAPSDVGACCSLKSRHTVGRETFKLIEEIESATRKHSLITWTDHPIPLGKIDTMKASTTTPSTDHDDFESREKTFTQALKALEPNNTSHMIALCGMGGVGKTTMMQRLKKVAKENRMFSYMVEAVIGEKTDPIAIQQAVADYLRIELKESTKPARANKLCEWFKANSGDGKNKFLVIFDDVWQSVDPEDIGLSPFPNQGVDFKVLLTSRDEHVCTMMGVKANSVINVGLLTEVEAQSLFQQFVETSEPELCKIGEVIVRKCCGLPIAIKTMACTLRNKRKDAWKDALSRIEHYDIRSVAPKVFETSYHNLQDGETKSVFLMCGLFPEDFDIPTEELMRYGWGLKLFDRVYTIREARTRLNTCIERLVQTNLLIESDDVGCVKMHDLVRAFVLGMYSEVEHASIVNHGNMHGWTKNDMNDSCKTVSLTCESVSEFPGDLKFPNLKILKLMHGDKTLRFSQDFYEGMEKLQVISYHKMKYPLLPSSPQCSTNLRVLHLHECSLWMLDCSCIGNLTNLEVLSFANSGIERIPSAIGNLKKLRQLDLRDCDGLCIEQGVLKNLVELEELYIGNASAFSEYNCNEMAERSNRLSALEFEFFNNKAQVKNMSFENLERFKISVGRSLNGDISESAHSYENTLQLVTNKGEISDYKLNELFVKTEVLCLSVDGMNDLEDVEVVIPKLETLRIDDMENLAEIWPCELSRGEKVKLREIKVRNCDKLLNLFLHNPMSLLHHLEELEVTECGSIASLFNIDLDCVGAIGEEDNNSILRSIKVENLGKLTEVWRIKGADKSHSLVSGFQVVESIRIRKCERFRNVFTPITTDFDVGALLEIQIEDCGGETGRFNESKESSQEKKTDILSEEETLREITGNISNVAFPSCLIPSFHNLHKLYLKKYEGVKVVFEMENPTSRELVTTHHNQQQPILLNLQELYLYNMDNMSHVWKCNRYRFFNLPKQQSESTFHNLTTIHVYQCKSIKYLFSPLMAELFSNLKKVHIEWCHGIEEVVSNRDDEDEKMTTSTHTTTTLFPQLDSLTLKYMNNLKCIGGGGAKDENTEISFNNTVFPDRFKLSEAGGVSWSLCQYSREIEIENCPALSSVIPCYAAGQMQKLRVLRIWCCNGIKEIFETQSGMISNKNKSDCNEGIPRVNNNVIMLPNLKILEIVVCAGLEHIFTFSAIGSLAHLEELTISSCESMKVIVKKEEEDASSSSSSSKKVVVFPRLKSIELSYLPELEDFFLGMNEFAFPSLDNVTIKKCPQMRVFAPGGSTTLQLKYIRTGLGKHTLDESGLKFFHVQHHQQTAFPSLHGATSFPATSEAIPWYFHNLIELDVERNHDVKNIIPSGELLQLQKLENISVSDCEMVEELFETALEVAGRNRKSSSGRGFDGPSQTTTLVNIPNLREMRLDLLHNLRYIGKSTQWTVYEFPNLTSLYIGCCKRLDHVFTSSMVGSLLQLQELTVRYCYNMEEVIVKDASGVVEEESVGKRNEILVLPRLKSLILDDLPCLKGFSLGKEDFSFPLLDTLEIYYCPAITASPRDIRLLRS